MLCKVTYVSEYSSVPAPLLSAFGSTVWKKERKRLFWETYFYMVLMFVGAGFHIITTAVDMCK